MTSILQLPEEVLLTIFNSLPFSYVDVLRFQGVCRAWYRPAHMKLLKCVFLFGPSSIEQFIAGIDSNPDPAYLRTVQTIYVDVDPDISPSEQYRLSKGNIFKLFCRFSNLKEITIGGDLVFLDNFNNEICETILKACSRLESFTVTRDFDGIPAENKMFNKIRLLLTKLSILAIDEGFGDLQEYMINFPRLRHVGDHTGTLDTFQKHLPVFEHLTYLNQLTIRAKGNEDVNYNDKYIKEHPLARKTLANIKQLNLLTCSLNSGAFDFIKKYLTGIILVTATSLAGNVWLEAEEFDFCNNTLDLIPYVQNTVFFKFRINFDALANCLPDIVRKVFRQVPQHTNEAKRTLHIGLNNSSRFSPSDQALVTLEAQNSRRSIEILFEDKLSLEDITTDLLSGSAPIFDIDSFMLDIKGRRQLSSYDCEATMEMYNDMLGLMPALKKVYLDIPLSFRETKVTPDEYNELDKVEDVVLSGTGDARFQTLLDGFYYLFPNIKRLSIYYFSGIWRSDMGDFQLDLPRYSLECLTLDVTTVIAKMEDFDEDQWFILDVEFLIDSEWCRYGVSTDDLSFTQLSSPNDLNGLVRGKDYFRVHITVYDLQTLKICRSKNNRDYEKELYSCLNGVREVTIFSEELQ